MPNTNHYAFEKIPYGRLPIKISRRKLLSALMTEMQAFNKKTDGGVVLKLADLGNCPDDELALMIPTIVPECKISIEGGFVFGKLPSISKPFELFPLDTPAVKIFNLFNGMTTIDEISEYVSHETNWDPVRSFAYTRGFFLWLVLAGVCLPKGS